jgi:hypothetical protein
MHRRDHEHIIGISDEQPGARRESLIGLIGSRLNGYLTANPMRTTNPSDYDTHL